MLPLASLLASRSTPTLISVAALLAPLALQPSPNPIPLIGLLTSAILHVQSTRETQSPTRGLLFLLVVTVTSSLSTLRVSHSALSSSFDSFGSTVLVRLASATCTLVPVWASWKIVRLKSRYGQFAAFPALFATINVIMSHFNPIGRLGLWSPSGGIGAYNWTVPILGVPGLDYLVGLWAILCANLLGDWCMQAEDDEESDRESRAKDGSRRSLLPVVLFLFLLALPSFFRPQLAQEATTFPVSCILPARSTGTESALQTYLAETSRYCSRAKVLIWPESAVEFDSAAEMEAGFEQVTGVAKRCKVWIGVGYRERFGDRAWNGFALLGPDGLMGTYHKRSIVPIAESYGTHAGLDAPPILDIPLPPPANIPAVNWSSSVPRVRTIAVAPSICLDFSVPLPRLSERPSLLLAPAHTFHPDIGRAMYGQAKMRALELGASLLWCDGGKGGSGVWSPVVSGEAWTGNVGRRTFVWDASIQWPWDKSRTFYSWAGGVAGDLSALALFWLVFFLVWSLTAVQVAPANAEYPTPSAGVGWRAWIFKLLPAQFRQAPSSTAGTVEDRLIDFEESV